ncbi:hypothetical protein OESDEN_21391, partial [Oesophagostomum dentatum]
MEECQDIPAVKKKKIKCCNCGGPHYRSSCPLLCFKTSLEPRALPVKRGDESPTKTTSQVMNRQCESARIGAVFPSSDIQRAERKVSLPLGDRRRIKTN